MPSPSKTFKRFYPLRTLKKPNNFFVFDVETWGKDGRPEAFALGVVYGPGYVFQTEDINELRKELLSDKFKGKIIFAHNAMYDLGTVFGNLIVTLDHKAVFNGSRFILAKKNNITFADSFNILPTALANIGELIGEPKGITPDKFKQGIRQPVTAEDFEYCLQDCKVTYKALENVFEEIGCIRVTLASLSMAYFRRKFLKEPIYYNELNYHFFDSYYGGRTEAFKIGNVYAQKFDINSMYPFAMRETYFPHPNKMKMVKGPDTRKLLYYIGYYEGLAKIKVRHKETYFGFLPYKTPNGKLCFPNGTFSGTWNFNELRFALENNVIEILSCEYCIYSPKMPTIFKEFVNTIYARRQSSTNDFEKYFLKLVLNSLYGKFAQKKKINATYVPVLSTQVLKGRKNVEIVPFSIEREDAYLIETTEELSYNTIPSFSSYITSYARVMLLKSLLDYEKNDPVYVDTDSMAINNYEIEIPTANVLGAWKKEPKIITEIIGNKSYVEQDGSLVMKGVRKNAREIAPGVYQYERMIKPREALRRRIQPGQFQTITKKTKHEYDKRIVYSDGTTSPLIINEDENYSEV